MKILVVIFGLLLVWPASAQREFLTADEIDQIRLVQEPNARLSLYVSFAKQRVALIEQLLSTERAGRSSMIHTALNQYTQIIDAIDTVADDALKRGQEIDGGMAAVADAEEEMLEVLRKIQESEPKDMALYRFVLEQAVETTEDSLELTLQDLGDRATEVRARHRREEEKLEGLMQPQDVEARRAAQQKEAEEKKKIPSLYREGEKPKEQRR